MPGRQASNSNFEAKSESGNASDDAARMMVLKLSSVEHSTCMRAVDRRAPI
jgi:hypothetical protein